MASECAEATARVRTSSEEIRDIRLVDDHAHAGLAVSALGLGAVEPDGIRVVHGDGEGALNVAPVSDDPSNVAARRG